MEGIEARIKNLEQSTQKHETSLESIDGRVHLLESNIKLLDTKLNILEANTNEIKADLKELIRLREKDHYIAPLEKSEKIKFQMVAVVIGMLVTYVVFSLFPMLKQ